MKALRAILIVLNLLFGIGMLAAYSAQYINPDKYWYISLFSLGYFIWAGANLVLAVTWLFVRWKWSFFSLAILVVGLGMHTRMIRIRWGASPPTKNPVVKIISYNIQLFKFYDWKNNQKKRDEILQFLKKNPADIYCFQEYFQTDDEIFATTSRLKDLIPEHHMHFEAGVKKDHDQLFGLATFSRFPIVDKGVLVIDSVKNRTNMVIYTDVLLNGDTTRIYNVHLASNHLNTSEVDSMMNTSEKSVLFARKWVKKLRNGYKRRYNQVNLLTGHLDKCPYPAIIGGDFNDTPLSYTYRVMSSRYTDSFMESGSGIGATYNGNLPLLRIDYIFHSNEFRCSSFKVHSFGATDHYPIVAEIYRK